MAVRLAAHMDDSGREYLYSEGFASSDLMAGLIADVLRRNGLHYEEPFVCITIYGEGEDPHDERQPAFRAFGPPVILKPELLGEITIACAIDFQNAVSRNKRNPEQIKKLFRDLRNPLAGAAQTELLELLRKRPSETWAEARIYRRLFPGDIEEDRYRRTLPLV